MIWMVKYTFAGEKNYARLTTEELEILKNEFPEFEIYSVEEYNGKIR